MLMVTITVILLAAAVVAAIDIPPLVKKRFMKDLWIFTILMCIGVGLNIAQALQIGIPNPIHWIDEAYKLLNP